MARKTKILEITGTWAGILDRCRATVKKDPLNKEPSEDFKRRLLLAEHSPLRHMVISWEWRDIPYWLSTEFSRHKFEKYISSQRNDRQTAYDRDAARQDAPVNFIGEANVQQMKDMMMKRLCGAAHPRAQEYAESLKVAVHEVQPEVADSFVPKCVFQGGCPEMRSCGKWNSFKAYVDSVYGGMDVRTLDLKDRYAKYNEWFNKTMKRKTKEEAKRLLGIEAPHD